MVDHSDLRQAAADFLIQAIAIDADPLTVAAELGQVERDQNSAVFAVEVASNVGPAAFLVYVYERFVFDGKGRTGQQRFTDDLDVLQTATERDTPGPRLLASAEGNDVSLILATTPDLFRKMTGAEPATPSEPAPLPTVAPEQAAEVRRESAEELLKLLRSAEGQATNWLAAVQAEANTEDGGASAANPEDEVTFDDVETELALFLLSDDGVKRLLRLMNLFLTAARSGMENMNDSSSSEEPPSDQNGKIVQFPGQS